MRKLYLTYQIWKTASSKLSCSHYLELIKIDEEQKRNFYLKETINCVNYFFLLFIQAPTIVNTSPITNKVPKNIENKHEVNSNVSQLVFTKASTKQKIKKEINIGYTILIKISDIFFIY